MKQKGVYGSKTILIGLIGLNRFEVQHLRNKTQLVSSMSTLSLTLLLFPSLQVPNTRTTSHCVKQPTNPSFPSPQQTPASRTQTSRNILCIQTSSWSGTRATCHVPSDTRITVSATCPVQTLTRHIVQESPFPHHHRRDRLIIGP